tara:strand:- start:7 stop:405 length:399 start_codon:yes stop_codon:yes gene_type:complete
MRIPNTILSVSLFLLTSCYIDYKAHDQHNESPRIQDAEAACWWNPTYQDYVWSFDVLVSHPDGSSEISDVFVDIYQLSYLGTLYLSPDFAGYWRLVIDERETPLWCGDFYEMEVVAYDWDGNWDALGLSPDY